MKEVQVFICGGGPAGLAAGIFLAQAGISTLVCERKWYPVDKACGEGVMPEGVRVLRQLGLETRLKPGDFSRFQGVRYIAPSGKVAQAPFRVGEGWGIRRKALSAALFMKAKEVDCLEVWQGIEVKNFLRRHERIEAQVGKERISTRLLIGADGLNSAVRHWANLESRRIGPKRWGARQHFEIEPWTDFVEVYWGNGVEAYVTPAGEKQVGIAFLWDRNRFKPEAGGKGLVPALLERFPTLKERLGTSSPTSEMRAAGPLFRQVKGITAPGVLLIGDAAGYLDALTGEGISLSLQAAEKLGSLVAPLFTQEGGEKQLSGASLMNFDRTYRRIKAPHERITHLALFLSRHPRLLDVAVKLLGDHPAFFSRLL